MPRALIYKWKSPWTSKMCFHELADHPQSAHLSLSYGPQHSINILSTIPADLELQCRTMHIPVCRKTHQNHHHISNKHSYAWDKAVATLNWESLQLCQCCFGRLYKTESTRSDIYSLDCFTSLSRSCNSKPQSAPTCLKPDGNFSYHFCWWGALKASWRENLLSNAF